MQDKYRILVSSCLLGENCKYNGGNNYNNKVESFCKANDYLAICPEVFAGLLVPRNPIEIRNGKVVSEDGTDYTNQMDMACSIIDGIIESYKPNIAILKAKSPSCGYKKIYDGTFSHTLTEGNGKACDCILKHGIKVFTEEDF